MPINLVAAGVRFVWAQLVRSGIQWLASSLAAHINQQLVSLPSTLWAACVQGRGNSVRLWRRSRRRRSGPNRTLAVTAGGQEGKLAGLLAGWLADGWATEWKRKRRGQASRRVAPQRRPPLWLAGRQTKGARECVRACARAFVCASERARVCAPGRFTA